MLSFGSQCFLLLCLIVSNQKQKKKRNKNNFNAIVFLVANGVYQNTIFGMAAKLPIKYTGAVVLGSNISGTFTAIISILSSTFTSSQRTAAIYYFITALLVLLICFDSYFALPLNVRSKNQPIYAKLTIIFCCRDFIGITSSKRKKKHKTADKKTMNET